MRRNEDGGRKRGVREGGREGRGKRRRVESRQTYHLQSPAGGLPGFHGDQHHYEDTPNKAHLHSQCST